jgi:hypothetical protein
MEVQSDQQAVVVGIVAVQDPSYFPDAGLQILFLLPFLAQPLPTMKDLRVVANEKSRPLHHAVCALVPSLHQLHRPFPSLS